MFTNIFGIKNLCKLTYRTLRKLKDSFIQSTDANHNTCTHGLTEKYRRYRKQLLQRHNERHQDYQNMKKQSHGKEKGGKENIGKENNGPGYGQEKPKFIYK